MTISSIHHRQRFILLLDQVPPDLSFPAFFLHLVAVSLRFAVFVAPRLFFNGRWFLEGLFFVEGPFKIRIGFPFLVVDFALISLLLSKRRFWNFYFNGNFCLRNLHPDDFLDSAKMIRFCRINKSYGSSFILSPSRASDPVYVIFIDQRNVKIDHMAYHSYVQSPSCHICSH